MSTLRDTLIAEDTALGEAHETNTPKRELALALRALRKRANLTQQQIAARSGLTQSRVSKMEAPNGPMPTTESLTRYAEACGSNLCIAFPPLGTQHTQLGQGQPVWAVI